MQDVQTVFKTASGIGSQEVFDFNKSTGTPMKSLTFIVLSLRVLVEVIVDSTL